MQTSCVFSGVNGAGKTTQLQIITGELEPDSGEVIKARPSMRIAYLTQEFDVNPGRTVREEFLSAYDEQIQVQFLALFLTGCCTKAGTVYAQILSTTYQVW